MIPKVIHYCWFGKNPKPKLAKKCIKSWKKYLKGYDIIEWNEENFDINSNQYVKEAYESKKWAFVTDYVRLWAMYTYGGIYMDTDVEVLKSFDKFLCEQAFSGFENDTCIPTGIMAAEKNSPIIKELLDYYANARFIMPDGSLNTQTNVTTITNMMLERGFVPNNTYQCVSGFTFYPKDYFCPKDAKTGELNITENTVTIHHFDGSWLPEKYRKEKAQWHKSRKRDYILHAPNRFFQKLFGKGLYEKIKSILKK